MKNKNFEKKLPRLLAIEAFNNIVLSQNGKVIDPRRQIWNWKNTNGEANPVAFDLNAPKDPQLIVYLMNQNVIPPGATLRALAIDGLTKMILYSGKIADAFQSIVVTAVKKPAALSQLPYNMLYWEIVLLNGEVFSLGSSFIEMFWVNMKFVSASLCKKGTPVEILRHSASLLSFNAFFTESVQAVPVNVIVNSVFNCVPPRYDIWHGAPHFTNIPDWNQITLHYNAYIHAHHNSSNSILNCYDTAAVLQYTLLYNGYSCGYCYMRPFGYLFLSNLIGRGQCNNPLYGRSGSWPTVYQNDPDRTAFDNHAFVYSAFPLNNTVADACAGPHSGNETVVQYTDSATDATFPRPPRVPRGNPGNIGYYNGVISVNAIQSMVNLSGMPQTDEFKKIVEFVDEDVVSFSNRHVAGHWPDVLDYPLLHTSWERTYEEIIPGDQEVLKMIFLTKKEKMLTIKIYVGSGDNRLMYNRFLSLSLSQMGESPYKKGPDHLGTYSAISENGYREYRRCFLVYYNIVVDIISNEDTLEIEELGKWYYTWAQKNLTSDLIVHLPSVAIRTSDLNAGSGRELHLSLVECENALIDFVHSEETPRLISYDGKNLVFDNLQHHHKELTVLVIDKGTLLVNKTPLKLNE